MDDINKRRIDAGQPLNLEYLRRFVVVAEELSFTRASARLHLVQSGVSSAVKALERDLGTELFDRDRHRVLLTDVGQVLLPEARATLAAAQAARDAVSQAQGGLRGTITVGTMLSTGPLNLPGVLERFHRAHPGVTVRLRMAASGSAGLARQVLDGSLDLYPPGSSCARWQRSRWSSWASSGIRWELGRPRSPSWRPSPSSTTRRAGVPARSLTGRSRQRAWNARSPSRPPSSVR
jgi:DNA-binding transcriptional LysR family regulator